MRRKSRNIAFKAFSKILMYDQDWDYEFMLIIERKKLQLMVPYYEGYHAYTISNDLRLCIRLLDIALGEDADYKNWLKESQEDSYPTKSLSEVGDIETWLNIPTQWKRKPTDFPKQINVRNANRFLEKPLPELDGTYDALSSYIIDKVQLRRDKALHLYHLIRMYHMKQWTW